MNIVFLAGLLDQLVNQAAKMRYMFGGQVKIPLVVRLYLRGAGGSCPPCPSHACSYMHFPGSRLVAAATPHDVKGLLFTAIEDENPVTLH